MPVLDFPSDYDSFMAHLGKLAWSSELNQAVHLGEPVRAHNSSFYLYQFVIFKPLSYCFEETIGFDVKASFASRPELRLIR